MHSCLPPRCTQAAILTHTHCRQDCVADAPGGCAAAESPRAATPAAAEPIDPGAGAVLSPPAPASPANRPEDPPRAIPGGGTKFGKCAPPGYHSFNWSPKDENWLPSEPMSLNNELRAPAPPRRF